jgi:hypothetical protein
MTEQWWEDVSNYERFDITHTDYISPIYIHKDWESTNPLYNDYTPQMKQQLFLI